MATTKSKEETRNVSKMILERIKELGINVPALELGNAEITDNELNSVNSFLYDLHSILDDYYMEKTMAEMKVRHDIEISHLQSNCPHPRYGWGRRATMLTSGFLSRYDVKLCSKCQLEVGRRRHCTTCGAEMLDGNWKEGDGTDGRPLGIFFCTKCWDDGATIKEG